MQVQLLLGAGSTGAQAVLGFGNSKREGVVRAVETYHPGGDGGLLQSDEPGKLASIEVG